MEDAAAARPAIAPIEAVWAPDGSRFAWQQDGAVWLYDIPSKSMRQVVALAVLNAAATAVPTRTAFDWQNRRVKEQTVQWFPGGDSLLLSAGGDLFQFHLTAGDRVQLTATPVAEQDPKLSPNGRRVSFLRGNDLYSMDVSSRKVARLTRNGTDTLLNGRLDWVYPEELGLGTAHWWSPDSARIAYLQFDVSRQPLFPHADMLPLRPVYEPQRYPKAGDPNADVRLGVVPAKGGSTRWMELGDVHDSLLARVYWHPDSRGLFVQRLNRIQSRLDLVRADAASRRSRVIVEEKDPYWVNLGDFFHFLKGGVEFLWASERDGFRHLYRYAADGNELGRLTSGDWEVTGLAGVDETAGQVYFLSTEASPLDRQLYQVSLQGGERRRLTRTPGTHVISMSPGCQYYLGTFSSLDSPPTRSIYKADGSEWTVLTPPDRGPLEEYDIRPGEIVEVKASGGYILYARLIRPPGFDPARKYPAIVFVYGGPHSQDVTNSWEGLTLEQALAHRGYAVWQLDNRGTAGRGHIWESALYRNFGEKELQDQVEGVRHLVSMGFVDESRLGVYGWSYGGYMTLYALVNAPDLFRAGVAGAPVVDWRHYDTIYTERYMGLPSDNADAYRRSSPIHGASSLKAKLLLIHNLEDDNVLFQNTMQMADALQRAGRPFEMMIYPQKTHGVTGQYRRHMYQLIVSFFDRSLRP
ncbi:MAG TPA: S9 family peptidase [Bryobacteraceae bacterium]|nr:S9 family peptidase [Bryobacteraceae bacterium]